MSPVGSPDFFEVPIEMVSETGEGSATPPEKPRSKRERPPFKVRATRKAARVALRRMRGLPDEELIVLSSDEEADEAPPSLEPESDSSFVPVVHFSVRRMNPRVQPSD